MNRTNKTLTFLFLILAIVSSVFSEQKVAIILAPDKFNETELSETRKLISDNQINIVTVSASKIAKGMSGLSMEVDLLIEELNLNEVEALIFIGGPGCREYVENYQLHTIIQLALEKGKIIAAICLAPLLLKKAGILDNRKFTAHVSVKSEMVKNSQGFTEQNVVVDENIVTANGPESVKEFTKEIINLLKNPWRRPSN